MNSLLETVQNILHFLLLETVVGGIHDRILHDHHNR